MVFKTCEVQTEDQAASYALDLRDRTFSISHLQILDEQGHLDESLEPDLSSEQLLRLYRGMLKARQLDDRLLKLQRQGRLGTFPMATGQEASACAPVIAMRDTDWFVGSFREPGGRLLRGEPVENACLLFNGFEEGNQWPGCERTLPVAVIIGAQCLHAVGIAYAMRQQGETDTAVVCFLGDGATSEGDTHEAMNFASVWQVPVVFICQNNQWAISLPRKKQAHSETLAQRAIAYDMPGIQVDGNDPLAMYQATKDALDRARAGGGPTFIEAMTYRLLQHTTSDDPTRYQPPEQLEAWQVRDPLIRFKSYMEHKGLWDDQKEAAYLEEVKAELEQAVKAFEERQTQARPDAPFDHVYGTKVPKIEQQRGEFLAKLKKDNKEGGHA